MDCKLALLLLRESLSAYLNDEAALAVMMDLTPHMGSLASNGEFVEWTRGPVADALALRVGVVDAEAVLCRMQAVVDRLAVMSASDMEEATVPDILDSVRRIRSCGLLEEPTRPLPIGSQTVRLVVCSGGTGLWSRLGAVAEDEPMELELVSDLRGVERGDLPSIIIVDAMDFPSVDVREVARTLSALSCLRVVWGAEFPYGRRLLALCAAQMHRPLVPLDPSLGLDPLVDMVRSRRFRQAVVEIAS